MSIRAFTAVAVASMLLARHAHAAEVEAVIDKLAESERSLRNIVVVSQSREEIKAIDAEKWKHGTAMTELTLWHDGAAGGPARVDVSRQILAWINGPAAAGEMKYSASFNGTEGKYILLGGGTVGKTSPASKADVLLKRPAQLDGPPFFADGRAYSIYFFDDPRGQSLSGYIRSRYTLGPNGHVTVADDRVDGVQAIKLRCSRGAGTFETWWLDANRGFAMLRYTLESGGREVIEKRVSKLERVADGVWYPSDAYQAFIQPDPKPGTPLTRTHYTAAKIVANDPAFDRKVFDAEIPANFGVTDEKTGKTYFTGPSPKTLSSELEAALKEATGVDTQSPTTNPAAQVGK